MKKTLLAVMALHMAAFTAKSSAHGLAYERKEDPLGDTIEKMTAGLEQFKKTQGETVAELRSTVEKLETRLSRPGALAGPTNAAVNDDRIKLFDEKTGKPALVLKAGDNIEARYKAHKGDTEHDSEASLTDFVRGVAGMQTRSALIKKSLSTGTDTAGGYTLPDMVFSQVLAGLVAESSLLQAGAVMMPMGAEGDGAKTYSYAAINAIPTASWRAEQGSIAESDPTFRQVLITPRSLAFFFKVSRELLMDSSNINATLNLAISQAFAKEMDRAGLLGTGTAPQPRGIINTSGVQTVGNGANGASLATLRYGNLFSASQAILDADAGMPTAAIMSHRTRVGFGQLADTTNQPLEVPTMLRGINMLSTSQIPNNLTVGSSSDCSSMVVGKFGWMGYAMRENVSIQMLRELFAGTGEVGFMAHARVDVMCFYPQAFAVVSGIRA